MGAVRPTARAAPTEDSSQPDVRYRYLLDSGNFLGHATPHRETIVDQQPSTIVGRAINGGLISGNTQGVIPGSIDNVHIIPGIDTPALSVQQLAQKGFSSWFPAVEFGGGCTSI